jgi:Flp pilus assembly protein TadD
LERAHQQFGTLETLASRAEGLGSIAWVQRQLAEAADQFREAARYWEQLARPYDYARALGNLGSVLAEVGSADLARSAYGQALTIFDSLADQLDNPALKASFLASPLVRANREAYLKLKQDSAEL